jgi:hypothetical protein
MQNIVYAHTFGADRVKNAQASKDKPLCVLTLRFWHLYCLRKGEFTPVLGLPSDCLSGQQHPALIH